MANDVRQKLVHLHSASVKVPTAAQLEYGEIAVQYDATAPVLYIKNSSDQIVKFIDEAAVKALLTNVYTYKGSKATYEELPSANNVPGDVWNVVAAHGNVPAGTNYAWDGTAWDSLGGSVDLSTYVTNDTFTAHTSNSDIHVTTAQTAAWDAKQDNLSNSGTLATITDAKVTSWDNAVTGLTAHTADTDVHVTTTDKTAWNGVVTDFETHSADTDIHVTTSDKSTWNGKQDALANANVLTGISAEDVTDWNDAATNSHSHSNKALLDSYTQTESDLADAVSKKHSHSNAAALDTVTAEKIASWDSAATDSHTHANQSVLDGIASTDVDAWDGAVNTLNTHTADTTIHVTTAQTAAWDAKQDAINDLTDIRNNAASGASAYTTVAAKEANWDAAYTVSQNALVGIETGKESGVSVNGSKELDFSGLSIDCGTY